MKPCPKCGYEQNRDSVLMCGLCGGVFAEAAEKIQPQRLERKLHRYRKDFAAEIRDNHLNSIVLIIGFPILIMMIGVAFGLWFGVGMWGLVGAAAISITLVIAAFYEGDRTILELSSAREASAETEQQLINVVDEMRIAAGLPMPKVYVIDSDSCNAFATGRDPDHASVAVTAGLMNTLNREELQGVIGHEMSHVRNFDIRYMMLVSALVGAVVLLADGFWRGSRFGMGRIGRRSFGRGSGGAGAIVAVIALLFVILSPLFAMLLQMSISRKREFLADAASVELTRNPLALANALEKLEQQSVLKPLEFANRATQHLFIVNPIYNYSFSASALFSTHPPTEARVRVLRSMAD
ncbi:zinc metalloprotease HtpX [candidate division KSB1 bacterium]|nr:MAG: zinc metalloprotease HtpX [candidate division KSB1 bacterium]